MNNQSKSADEADFDLDYICGPWGGGVIGG